MEWFVEDPRRGLAALIVTVLALVVMTIWLGRRKPFISVPVASLFLILLAIAIPSYMPARPLAFRNACINNLRLIRDAKNRWATENHKSANDVPTDGDLYSLGGTNRYIRHNLICPAGGTYAFKRVEENPICSLSQKGHRLE